MYAEVGSILCSGNVRVKVEKQIVPGTCRGCHFNHWFDCAKDIDYECDAEKRPDKTDIIFTKVLKDLKNEPS